MKLLTSRLLLLVAILVLSTAPSRAQEKVIEEAKFTLQLLLDRKYDDFCSRTDPVMQKTITAVRLQQIWEGVLKQVGEYERTITATEGRKGAYIITTQYCKFSKGQLKIHLTFDENLLISGLFFSPEKELEVYEPPAYVNDSKFLSIDKALSVDSFTLPGTLTVPKHGNSFPAVVLIHGSGPLDQDLSIGKLKMFRDLALGLSTNGIVVYRYDKRTKTYSNSFINSNLPITPEEEVIQDAVQSIRDLKTLPMVDSNNVFVLGHSLGAMLAPLIVERAGNIRGTILMGGSFRSLHLILKKQFKYIFGLEGWTDLEKENFLILKQKIKRIKKGNYSFETNRHELPLSLNAEYWKYLASYSPKEHLLEGQPYLVMHAKRDYQITKKDLKSLKKGLRRNPKTIIEYSDLFHPFIQLEHEGMAVPDDYKMSGHVPKYVLEDILSWIRIFNTQREEIN